MYVRTRPTEGEKPTLGLAAQARWIRGAHRILRKVCAEPGSGVVPNRAERRRATRKAKP